MEEKPEQIAETAAQENTVRRTVWTIAGRDIVIETDATGHVYVDGKEVVQHVVREFPGGAA